MSSLATPTHRLLDLLTVVVFLAAPSVFHLSGPPEDIAYLIAAVHLLMTILTIFPPAGRGVVPFALHGTVELLVGLGLVTLTFALRWTGVAHTFYLVMGIVMLLIWTLSEYKGKVAPRRR
ncbi:MAG TPA: hypothetical protein VFN22_05850 [Gemmatimonadales bacterium]|nr:hypothetical protein [Gemmatimonadales bacterium]